MRDYSQRQKKRLGKGWRDIIAKQKTEQKTEQTHFLHSPMIAISNEQLQKAPPLKDTWQCSTCGQIEKVKYSEPRKDLQYVEHKGHLYLVGAYGKALHFKKPRCFERSKQ